MRLIDYIVKTAKNINPQYSPSVIIDAGSRDLGQSIEFSNEFPTAQIYAFEPNPHQYQICVDLAREYKNIKVLPFALSDIDGEATFHVTPSNIATCGIYWYRRGKDFVDAAESMFAKNIRVNNEFYIAPVYNEMIGSGQTVIPFFVQEMHGIGTPEDLNAFLSKSAK
jgi:FkbM family methyltransferase